MVSSHNIISFRDYYRYIDDDDGDYDDNYYDNDDYDDDDCDNDGQYDYCYGNNDAAMNRAMEVMTMIMMMMTLMMPLMY